MSYDQLSLQQKLAYEALALNLRAWMGHPRPAPAVRMDVVCTLESVGAIRGLPPRFAVVRRLAVHERVLVIDELGQWAAGPSVDDIPPALLIAVEAGVVKVP